jgi:hypothetical protein
MKKLNILFLLIILGTVISCRKPLKDVQDYFPEVKTVSAVIEDDGSVTVTGEIISQGKAKGSAIENAGICFSTNSEPKMHERQVIASLSDNTFSVSIPAITFNADSTYYFRTWAVNDYGYSYGGILKLDSIEATPVVAPCTLPNNSFNAGSFTNTYYSINPPDANYYFSTSSSTYNINYQFGSPLANGIFTTVTGTSPGYRQVSISLWGSWNYGGVNAGSTVYVNQLTPTTFEITVCSATWTTDGMTLNFNTHFTTP